MTNDEFQKYVLSKLDEIAKDVNVMKGQSAFGGAVSGFITSVIVAALGGFVHILTTSKH